MTHSKAAATRQRPWPTAALAGIVLLAAAARLWGLAAESLWLDEATSLMLARMPVSELIAWTALDIHPPLYYTLLHYWILLGESEAAVRGLSALAGVLTVPVIYGLGCAWFGRRVGLIAAALLAVNPYHVWYSQEARMYALVALLMGAAVLAAFCLWEDGAWWAWAGHVIATAAAWYTHYYAVFGILLVNLMFAYLLARRRVGRRLLWRWLAAQAVILLLFARWLPTFLLP
ncbi:MAG: glycosyltransferase family 39 protein, partial [Chloroflexota bacterium]